MPGNTDINYKGIKHRYIICNRSADKKASLGYLGNGQEISITNSWIFLALNMSNLFSIDMLDKRRIDIYFIQEFVISMRRAN